MHFSSRVLFIDIESHSVNERDTLAPEDFFRLGQYAWGEGPVRTTTNLRKFRRLISRASMVVGANILNFDLPAVFGDTMVGVKLARAGRVYDTHVASLTANPAPFGRFERYDGHSQVCINPPDFRRWIKLEQQAFTLGVPGKAADLSALTDKYLYDYEPVLTKTGKVSMTTDKTTGEKTPRTRKVAKEGICCQFGAVPVDDPDFLEYARQDIVAVREVARKLLGRECFGPYQKSAMLQVALAVQIGTGNGLRVDLEHTAARVKAQHEETAWVLNMLHDDYAVPVNAKKPLATKAGKEALLLALDSVGIPGSKLPRTAPTEAHPEGQPSFSAGNVLTATKDAGDRAKALGEAVATLAGQRSLGELLLAEVRPDGKVHPDIFPLQRSGRFSTTKPGLTIWDPNWKDCLISDSDRELLVEFDFSNADARAVAAMSGDVKFARRFDPGQDGHLINAHLLWGAEVVGHDKHDPVTADYRQRAKAPGHGIGYNMGANRMSATTGLSLEECKRFIKNYRAEYAGVVDWQRRVVSFAERYGFIVSDWGRRMPVEHGREHTQTPGLLGQNATHELLMRGVASCDDRHLRMIRLTVHDAFLASIPVATLQEDIDYFVKTFTTKWHPRGGQEIEFTLGYGTPARDWKAAQH